MNLMIPVLACVLSVFLPSTTFAAKKLSKTPARETQIDRDFHQACIRAFNSSEHTNEKSAPMGKEICDCTVRESKSQGVTQAELKEETARISANTKYQIQNHKLLSAFRACTIDMMMDLGEN